MEYGILVLLIIVIALAYMEISKLKEQVKSLQKKMDELCEATENKALAANFVSDEVKQEVRSLKNDGKEVEAVRKLREAASMDLLQAKQYVDNL